MKTNTVFLLGKAGSGKGTQAKMLCDKMNWQYFSTGAEFRRIKSEGGPLGDKIAEIIDNGYLVPGWFSGFLFQDKILGMTDEDGIVCEGSMRPIEETEVILNTLKWLERPYKAILLTVDEDAVIERLLKRAKDEGRDDDADIDSIKKRFKEFEDQSSQSVAHLKEIGNLVEVDGMQTPEEVHADIVKVLEG